MGRPHELTSEITQRVGDQFELGNGWPQAAQASGKSEGTLFRWAARGREEHARREEGAPVGASGVHLLAWCARAAQEDPFHEFWKGVETARLAFRNRCVGVVVAASMPHEAKRTIRTVTRVKLVKGVEVTETETTETIEHSGGEWQAAAWLAERRIPEDFSRRQIVTGPDGGPVQYQPVPADVASEALEWLARERGEAVDAG